MSKLDRQGVRRAQDLEQKYDLSAIKKNMNNAEQQKMLLSKVEQAVGQYTKATDNKLAELEQEMSKYKDNYIANSGWGANKVLGTDDEGNVVEKTIETGGGTSTVSPYPVGAVYTTIATDNPSDLFGGTWELIAEGQLLVGLEPVEGEEELQQVYQTTDKCFVWKRTA